MNFATVIDDLKRDKLAARRYEMDGHRRFRDCVYVCRNGKLRFERYSYGEAASLVFGLWAKDVDRDGNIDWDFDESDYSGRFEAPRQLTGRQEDKLEFDEKKILWSPAAEMKTYPEAGLSFWQMVFGG